MRFAISGKSGSGKTTKELCFVETNANAIPVKISCDNCEAGGGCPEGKSTATRVCQKCKKPCVCATEHPNEPQICCCCITG